MANPQRRAQITAAATELFDTLGYHAAGMTDIAKACGMGASSLYNHFSSKQDVLAEIITQTMQDLLHTHAAALAGATTPTDKLRRSMSTHVCFHAEKAQAARVVNQELNNLQDPARSIIRQMRRDYVARWTAIVRDGVDEGTFHVRDVKVACYGLIDMGIGVDLWFRSRAGYSACELGELYAEMALRLVAATPASSTPASTTP